MWHKTSQTVVGKEEMIRPTFYLFAEENLFGNYRGNIQVSSHVLPYDWRKHKNRTGWAYELNHQHDLIDKTPCRWIHSYLYRENGPIITGGAVHIFCLETQANLVWNQPQRMLRTYNVSRTGHTGPCVAKWGWQKGLLTKPQICRRGFHFPRLHIHSVRIHRT